MVQTIFTYPVILEPDEDGRPVVTFPDLPGAVTDGADEAEALRKRPIVSPKHWRPGLRMARRSRRRRRLRPVSMWFRRTRRSR